MNSQRKECQSIGGDSSINEDFLLVESGDVARNELSLLIMRFFSQADTVLSKLAYEGDDVAIQSQCFDGLREIHSQRDLFTEAYISSFTSNYYLIFSDIKSGAPLSGVVSTTESLEGRVLERAELEEQVLISDFILRAEKRFDLTLGKLATLYGDRLGEGAIDGCQLPMAPRLIFENFQLSSYVFDLSPRVKNILFDLFDQQVEQDLENMYDQICQHLQSQGVSLSHSPEQNLSEINSEAEIPLLVNPKHSQKVEHASCDSSFDLLCQLLDSECVSTSMSEENDYTLAMLEEGSSNKLLVILNELQSIDQIECSLNDLIRDALDQKYGLQQVVVIISEQEQSAIDLVDMIFEHIADDEGLSASYRGIVARLKVAVAKVAIQDKVFLSDKEHVVHELLSELTQAGLAGGKGVEAAATLLVDQVVNRFRGDVTLFSHVLVQFRRFVSNGQLPTSLELNEVRDSVESDDCRVRSTAIIDDIIINLSPSGDLPALIAEFINGVWKEELINTYINEGADSQEWRTRRQLTEELLWSLKPKMTQEEREYLQHMIPHLTIMLSDCLEGVSWDRVNIDSLFIELDRCHSSTLKDSNIDAKHIRELVAEESGNESTLAVAVEAKSDFDNYYENRVAELKIGQWVEFRDERDELIRGKLVWRGKSSGQMVFSNWQNSVVRRCSKETLAKMIQHWDAKILSSVPMLDRMFSSITSVLRSNKYDD